MYVNYVEIEYGDLVAICNHNAAYIILVRTAEIINHVRTSVRSTMRGHLTKNHCVFVD